MRDLQGVIRQRHSARVPFDPERPVSHEALAEILEAASWAPTAHNMQNYEVIVVEDPSILRRLGDLKSGLSLEFIRENYKQLSFSAEELKKKKTGILAAMFPPSWRDPALFSRLEEAAFAEGPSFMSQTIRHSPTVLVVTYDTRKRAPASEGDVLGFISLGCVLQTMWLVSESLGIGFQVMSAFSSPAVEPGVRKILGFPEHEKIAYAVRLGYPQKESEPELQKYLRVRRDISDFVHLNRYGENFPSIQEKS